MTLEELRQRLEAIVAEMDAITAAAPDTDLEGEPAERFANLTVEAVEVRGNIERIEARQKQVAELRQALTRPERTEPAAAPTIIRKAADPFDLDSLRGYVPTAEMRSRAKAAVESVEYLDDDAKQEATLKLEGRKRDVVDPRGVLPGLICRTGHPDYVSAFGKGLAGFQAAWTDAERRVVMAVEEYRTAMSLTDGNGGYAIPFVLDPSIILANDGSANPVRQVARVVSVTGDNWHGISTAGVDASFDADNAEVSDDSPTFAQPEVVVRMARAFVQGSIAISMDFPNLTAELGRAFADAKDRLEATKFWSGSSASNEPVGLETALAGGTSIVTAAAESLAVADVYKTHAALAPRYRGASPVWMAEASTINAIRQFATANNYHAYLTDLGGGQPSMLLGYRLYEWSAMDANSAINAAATAANHVLVLGDFSNYVIADRIGGSVEFIPHIFNTNANLPSFTRGWAYFWRVGADSVNDDGFALLNVATAA